MAYLATNTHQILSVEMLPVPDLLLNAHFDGAGRITECVPFLLLLTDNIAFQRYPRPSRIEGTA
jgi:hypothetical protein